MKCKGQALAEYSTPPNLNEPCLTNNNQPRQPPHGHTQPKQPQPPPLAADAPPNEGPQGSPTRPDQHQNPPQIRQTHHAPTNGSYTPGPPELT